MSNDNDLTPFEQRSRAVLQDSVSNLDGAMRSRLAQARATALAAREERRGWLDLRYLAPAGAVAASLLVALLIVGRHDTPGAVNVAAGNALDDLELLADADAYELSQEEDLEFIEWAAAMGEQDGA